MSTGVVTSYQKRTDNTDTKRRTPVSHRGHVTSVHLALSCIALHIKRLTIVAPWAAAFPLRSYPVAALLALLTEDPCAVGPIDLRRRCWCESAEQRHRACAETDHNRVKSGGQATSVCLSPKNHLYQRNSQNNPTCFARAVSWVSSWNATTLYMLCQCVCLFLSFFTTRHINCYY